MANAARIKVVQASVGIRRTRLIMINPPLRVSRILSNWAECEPTLSSEACPQASWCKASIFVSGDFQPYPGVGYLGHVEGDIRDDAPDIGAYERFEPSSCEWLPL